MRLDIVNPADWPHWDELVLATDGYSFFHSADWAQVLCATYNYKPAYFTLHGEGKLQALIPFMEVKSFLTGRRGVSLTFTDYCEPLVENQEVFNILLTHIIDYAKKSAWKHIDFRGGQQFLPNMPVCANYLGHTLVLSENEQDLLSTFRDSTRRNIRKAIDEGVETKIYTSQQSVRDFYRLHCLTRKRHGLPPQPFHFFRNIYDCVISRNHGFVVLASYNKKIIAGAVYFHFGTKGLYKFGASDTAYQHLRANNLVMWEAIKWFANNGYSTFCFGRTDHSNEGLRQFKKGWGAVENNINYYRYNVGEGTFVTEGVGVKAQYSKYFGIMPNPMLKMIGNILYRHMG